MLGYIVESVGLHGRVLRYMVESARLHGHIGYMVESVGLHGGVLGYMVETLGYMVGCWVTWWRVLSCMDESVG